MHPHGGPHAALKVHLRYAVFVWGGFMSVELKCQVIILFLSALLDAGRYPVGKKILSRSTDEVLVYLLL